jgi:hypothetical protein
MARFTDNILLKNTSIELVQQAFGYLSDFEKSLLLSSLLDKLG